MPKVHVDRELCKECLLCAKFCSQKVLERSEEMNKQGYFPVYPKFPEKCVGCRLCQIYCPDFAIVVEMTK